MGPRHVQPGFIRCSIYYGGERRQLLRNIENVDVVITTFDLVSRDWKECVKGEGVTGTLHSIKWRRLIVDEGYICLSAVLQCADIF
jgi:SNF2 family DNA or RNA helicase